jgi:hypothetical protein
MGGTSFADALGEGVILMHVGGGARRKVSPAVFAGAARIGHRVMLCIQASEFGSKLQQILDLIRAILAERRLFT